MSLALCATGRAAHSARLLLALTVYSAECVTTSILLPSGSKTNAPK
jgi:hypothetical protein